MKSCDIFGVIAYKIQHPSSHHKIYSIPFEIVVLLLSHGLLKFPSKKSIKSTKKLKLMVEAPMYTPPHTRVLRARNVDVVLQSY